MLTPRQLHEAATELATVERTLVDRNRRITARSECLRRFADDTASWWAGDRAVAARTAAAATIAPMRPLGDVVDDATRTVADVGRLAADLARRLDGVERALVHHHHELLRRQADVDHLWSTPGDVERVRAAIRGLEHERHEIAFLWTTRSRSAAAAIDHVAMSVPAADVPAAFGSVRLGPLSALTGATAPGDTAEVARWWADLDEGARRALLAIVPSALGNLDGLPVDVRADANRITMQRTLDAARPGSAEWLRMQQFTDPDRPGRIDAQRSFLVFDPAGDGLVAEVFGDVATADHVAVLVPGMGSTMAGFHDLAGRAERLHGATGSNTAVVAWTGYDAPAGAPSTRMFEVVSDRQAIVGGERLHRLVDGLRLGTQGSMTLVGHSYGSLTVGKALLDGARVERVVLMGSPGVGVRDIGEFPADAADEYFASEVKGDVVANLEHFGTEPTDPDFGAQVFDSGDGDARDPLGRHSEYYDDGIAIENLAAIITGGSPTAGRTDVIEYVTEPIEDLQDAANDVIDRFQDVDLPFVDDRWIDGVVEARQEINQTVDQLGQIVVEEVGHFGQDAVEWGVDRVTETWDDGVRLVTGWFD